MKKTGLFLAIFLLSSPASAKVLDLYGQVGAGGGYGQGVSGARMEEDYFKTVGGGAFGGLVGAEFMFVDAWVEHNQYTDGSGINGTWTQFMGGFDLDFPMGDNPPGVPPRTFGEVGIAVGYGLGTQAQVDVPLDNAQISDKGFLAQLSIGGAYKLNQIMSIGVAIPVQYGYLFKNDGSDANDDSQWYHSVHVTGTLFFRLHFELK